MPEAYKSPYTVKTKEVRAALDKKYGIISRERTLSLPQGETTCWVKDCLAPLNPPPAANSPSIQADQAHLRCLSRLQAIDYAIFKKSNNITENKALEGIYDKFSSELNEIIAGDLSEKDKLLAIQKLEQTLNDSLLEELHKENLTFGAQTRKEAEELLDFFSRMSSLVEPAQPVVILKGFNAIQHTVDIEIQTPVTKKTELQKKNLKYLQNTQLRLFADLMEMDDRALAMEDWENNEFAVYNAILINDICFDAATCDNVGDVRNDLNDLFRQQARKNITEAKLGSSVHPGQVPESVATENTTQLKGSAFSSLNNESQPLSGQLFNKNAIGATVGHIGNIKSPSTQGFIDYGNVDNGYSTLFVRYTKQLNSRNDLDIIKAINPLILVLESEIEQISKGHKPEKMDSKSLYQLQEVITCCNGIFEALGFKPDAVANPITNENISDNIKNNKELLGLQIEKLSSLANTVSGSHSKNWQRVGAVLYGLAAITVLAVGLVLALPTMGISLLPTLIAVTGLGQMALAGVAAGTVLGGVAAGRGASHMAEQKGLAKSVADFKSSLESVIQTETKKSDPTPGPT